MSGPDVRGFFHVCCLGEYLDVTWEIVHTLLESGLYDRSETIELGVLGDPEQRRAVEKMIKPFPRFRVAATAESVEEYEFATLGVLQDACSTWTGPVFYLHTKGVSRSPVDQYARYWRRLMLDEVVVNHQRCVAELGTADAVGTNWRGNHYSGNFWWARSGHVRRLPDIRRLQRFPRSITADPVWNRRLQCEFWLGMARGRFRSVGYAGLDLYRDLRWTANAATIVNELLMAGRGRRFAELALEGPSPYFTAVNADTKLSVSYRPFCGSANEQDYLDFGGDQGRFDVIFVDTWHEATHCLAVVEGCLPRLASGGAIVVHDTNPPTAWHQRPASDFAAGSEWNGDSWRAVIDFRSRHPEVEVFTVDTDWGCTVIRPSRQGSTRTDLGSSQALGWSDLEQRRAELLNLVDVASFRRRLFADRYLSGQVGLSSWTDIVNFMVAFLHLESFLEIGFTGEDHLAGVIAPIRQAVGTHGATFAVSSDEFFSRALGVDQYDVIFVDGWHEEAQCQRDIEHASARLSTQGWIVVHDTNPPTEWHQRAAKEFEPGSEWNGAAWKAVVRFQRDHPEWTVSTIDVDWGCTLIRRGGRPAPAAASRLDLPQDLEWGFFNTHRHQLLHLVPPTIEMLRSVLDSGG
jgi:predicted O-methyltransferase YrrM